MKQYYVIFVPHRCLEGELKENIYFSCEDALKGVAKHYRNLFAHEVEYYSKISQDEFIRMGNDEGCTIEPTTYKNLKKWISRDPKTLETLFEFCSEMHEELDMLWGYPDSLDHAYEIVELK